MISFPKKAGIVLVAGLLGGCAAGLNNGDFESVQKNVSARTGFLVQWRGITAQDAEVDESVHSMLAKPLGVDEAVQIALLNSRMLQANYEELGIAQADLVQAGLLKNPVFSIGARFPDRNPKKTYLDLSVEEDFIDIFLVPARKKLAAGAFEQAKSRVTAAVIKTAFETRQAFYAYQAAEQLRGLRQTVLEAQSASYDTAKRLHDAGNINDLALLGEKSQAGQARIALSMAEAEVSDTREHLTDLMGLWGNDTTWTAPGRLPEPPEKEVAPTGLESLAMQQRADLGAAKQDVIVLAQTLGFTSDVRFLSSLTLGPEAERETDGQWRIGPSLNVPIPIFDQGQAAVARATSLLRQSQQRYFGMAVAIRSQVRSARARMFNARDRVDFFRHEVLPVQQHMLEQTQRQYNGMLLGVFQLLQARRDQIEAGSEYITALHQYWNARTELEAAIGGRLPDTNPATKPAEPVLPPPAMPPMNGMKDMKDMKDIKGM